MLWKEEIVNRRFPDLDALLSIKPEQIVITPHAWRRMSQRSINIRQIIVALNWGKMYYVHNAINFVMTKSILRRLTAKGIRIDPKVEGLHVVAKVSSSNYTIITVYKNKDIKAIKKHAQKRFYAKREV